MKNQRVVTLAIGIGVVAGLRPMTALAAMAWAVRRGRIRMGPDPFVWVLSASTSKRIAQLAISELIIDKLPFTLSRLRPKPLALLSRGRFAERLYTAAGRSDQWRTERFLAGGDGRSTDGLSGS